MDWQAWRKALALYANTPELIYGSILVAIAIFGFAWWLRSRISKKRLAALHERLRLGKQVQEHITNELQSLKQKVSLEETTIKNLRSAGGVPRTQVELLSNANATVVSSLVDLEQANTNLGATLT
jgi:predicted negative regulator of RcsB-dependent stress response